MLSDVLRYVLFERIDKSYFSAKSFYLGFLRFALSLFMCLRKSLGDEHCLKSVLSFNTRSFEFYFPARFKLFLLGLSLNKLESSYDVLKGFLLSNASILTLQNLTIHSLMASVFSLYSFKNEVNYF